ncbi:glycerate kinase [Mesobacillus campisalis]|uniref:Glycerate kinase n=1 Tax=Mesobacillus campisalis TaxID=1408103 RepID=A0A0M2SZ10_9BACI|nr:glycerate kinase [Mesobacillus campisalis]KKK39393.1 glycerate kinase [Mesobacillus campisalis]
MKIVMIPSGFKESVSADEVAFAMEKGIRRFIPDAETVPVPMMDGGEGFTKAIVQIKKGKLVKKEVTGPVGESVMSHFGVYEEGGKVTAVLEMAAAAGLRLVPKDRRNPLYTTTYGVGELIKAALDLNVDKILIGCGDSGTSDGGAGMAQALGVQFLDKAGQVMDICGGGDLHLVHGVDLSRLDHRLNDVTIDAACNWHNVLCGPKGVAKVFGPQKGASAREVDILSKGLERYASIIRAEFGRDLRFEPGSGASGGLGAGLAAFAGATLHPRFDIIMKYIHIEKHICGADLVLTAEGCLDEQTPFGKIPSQVAKVAKEMGVPVIAIAGTIGKGAQMNYGSGIDAYMSIIPKPATLEMAMDQAAAWIADCAEAAIRHVYIGYEIAERKYARELA